MVEQICCGGGASGGLCGWKLSLQRHGLFWILLFHGYCWAEPGWCRVTVSVSSPGGAFSRFVFSVACAANDDCQDNVLRNFENCMSDW